MESVITSPEEQRKTKVVLNMMNIEKEDKIYARTVRGHSIAAQNQSSKILGVIWDHVTYTFKFDLAQLESYISSMQFCKRSVLRLTAKIFDPLWCRVYKSIHLLYSLRFCFNPCVRKDRVGH